jgi:hypothetical protein
VIVPRHLLLALSNPVEGSDDEFNRWYDEVHVPDVLAVPGICSAQRYQLRPGDGLGTYRYAAIYEISGDPETVLSELGRRVHSGEMALSEALDRSATTRTIFETIGELRVAPQQ